MDLSKEKIGPVLAYLVQRLKEPTTWLGLSVFVGFFGLSEDTINKIIHNGPSMVLAAGTILAIVFPEVGSVMKNKLDDTGVMPVTPAEAPFDPLDPAGARKEP